MRLSKPYQIIPICLFLSVAASAGAIAEETKTSAGDTYSDNTTELQQLSNEKRKASLSGADTRNIQIGFKRLDSDDDGKISLEEFTAFAEKHSDIVLNKERGIMKDDLPTSQKNNHKETLWA